MPAPTGSLLLFLGTMQVGVYRSGIGAARGPSPCTEVWPEPGSQRATRRDCFASSSQAQFRILMTLHPDLNILSRPNVRFSAWSTFPLRTSRQ